MMNDKHIKAHKSTLISNVVLIDASSLNIRRMKRQSQHMIVCYQERCPLAVTSDRCVLPLAPVGACSPDGAVSCRIRSRPSAGCSRVQ